MSHRGPTAGPGGRFGRAEIGWVGATLVVHALGGFVPLLGGPGYESALALGLLLPLPLAVASARLALRSDTAASRRAPSHVLIASVELAILTLALHLGLLGLHGARAGFCDAGAGLALFALGPAVGSVLAAVWGAVCGLLARWLPRHGRRMALALATLGPLAGVVASLLRFYSSPMIFAFDPFVGFFSGTLYDTVIDGVGRLLTYRAGSLGTLLVVVALGSTLRDSRGGGRPVLELRALMHPLPAALCLVGLGLSLGVSLSGEALGHYQSEASIRAALGHSLDGQRCEVVYASGVETERARLLARECDEHVASHEAFFDTRVEARITAFVFASAAQKGALMGASGTYVAKPWRHEVYVQNRAYPHPVLGHELAHVVAGTFGRGPLRIAGPLLGLVPDPGRIEGYAVAAAPSENSDYTLLEWTRALRELSLLPSLGRVFRLTFLGENSSTAYTVAGSFVAFLRQQYGAAALKAWYGGASVKAATGHDLASLEAQFHERLDAAPVPAPLLDRARARFDRPALFGRSCPHAVDALLGDARAALDRADPSAAEQLYDRVLRLDPSSFSARFGRARCARQSGAAPQARERLTSLYEDDAITSTQRALIVERLGDLALRAGDAEEALARYAEAEQSAFGEDRRRVIAVKRLAATGVGSQALIELLVGDERGRTQRFAASALIGAWSERQPDSGLPDYLLAKNLYASGQYARVAQYLDRALARDLVLTSVEREALRLRIVTGCALGDRASARPALARYGRTPELTEARRAGMARFAARCGLLEGAKAPDGALPATR